MLLNLTREYFSRNDFAMYCLEVLAKNHTFFETRYRGRRLLWDTIPNGPYLWKPWYVSKYVLAKYYKEETPIKTVGKNHPISDRTMSFLIYAIPSKKPLFPKTNIFKGMQHIHRIGTAVSSLQIIKVSKFQKQIFLFSFEPKTKRN